jgi:hypothetical protein
MRKYVVDLETAKKLKGYLPEGFKSFCNYKRVGDSLGGTSPWRLIPGVLAIAVIKDSMPAPILEEVLELLPRVVRFDSCILLSCNLMYYDKCERLCEPEIKIAGFGGNIGYVCANNRFQWNIPYFNNAKNESENDINAASAAAKLYMWLVDEGYITKEPTS